MFTIAGGIVLGFGTIWLILYLSAHLGEIIEGATEAIIALPKLLLLIAILATTIALPIWVADWVFGKLPDMAKALTVVGSFLLLISAFFYCAIRDFRKWLRNRHEAPEA